MELEQLISLSFSLVSVTLASHLISSVLSFPISVLCCGIHVYQTWLPVLCHFPRQASNMEWQGLQVPLFKFLGKRSVRPDWTSYPLLVQASVVTKPQSRDKQSSQLGLWELMLRDSEGQVIQSGSRRWVARRKSSVSLIHQLWKWLICIPPTAWKWCLVSWPVSMNPPDFFLFFIWSYFHLLSFLLLLSFSLLLRLSVDVSEK